MSWQKQVSQIDVGPGGYAYVVDSRNHLVAHPEDAGGVRRGGVVYEAIGQTGDGERPLQTGPGVRQAPRQMRRLGE